MKSVRTIQTIAGNALLLLLGTFLALLITEWIYRSQWFDFYADELNYLNNVEKKGDATILFFGDSFTAQQDGYVSELRQQLPTYQLINAAIPGTGIFETSYVAPDRIKNFQPDMIIFQLYVGNDLSDIRHPVNWKALNLFRNIYWLLCDRFHVLRYFNYKSGQLNSRTTEDGKHRDPKEIKSFSTSKYSSRVKTYLKADPELLDHSIFLREERNNDMEKLVGQLEQLIDSYSPDIRTIIVVIPHCSQVNDFYFDGYELLGAKFNSRTDHFTPDYPFINRLRQSFDEHQNVVIINPLEAIQSADRPESRIYFENDPHFSTLGNGLLAKELLPVLANSQDSIYRPFRLSVISNP